MEINNPNADRSALWYVTNGLLPIEMITGQIQVGDAQWEQQQPAAISAVGNEDNPFPTYADLGKVFTRQGPGARVGEPITGFFNPDGTTSGYEEYRTDPATAVAAVENGHGIPAGFLRYMDAQSGPLGRVFAFGHPVSGAYWVRVQLGGRPRPIMFQVFERRVLTYTPFNEPTFRVESGNVGRHYLRWRYPAPSVEVTPAVGPAGTTFTARVSGVPAGEQATVGIAGPPFSHKGEPVVAPRTITGDGGPVTFEIRTSRGTTSGRWAVVVARSTSAVNYVFAPFDVTQP